MHGMELEQLMTPKEVAKALGCAVQTLAAWRSTRRADLPYVAIGNRLIRYRRVDVEQFIERRIAGGPCHQVAA